MTDDSNAANILNLSHAGGKGEGDPKAASNGNWLQRKMNRLVLATRQSTFHYFHTPVNVFSQKKEETFQVEKNVSSNESWQIPSLNHLIFGNIPEHYTLDKKLTILKSSTAVGKAWDGLLILLSLLACGMYVAETYRSSFAAVKLYQQVEVIITNFFAVDFLYMFLAAFSKFSFLTSPWTIVDLITIIPVYITMAFQGKRKSPNLSVFRFVRILRLVRILRTFKLLGGLSGIKRQLVTLSLTLLSLIFMAAGIMQIMENDFRQQTEFKCKYNSAYTNYEPSCTPNQPFDPATCDCKEYNCNSYYNRFDPLGKPTGVRCNLLSFFDAFYFLVVTVATVGYGDISPSTEAARAVVIIFIVTSLVVIPMQVNQLTTLLSMNSQYRNPYSQQATGADNHVILCGHITDWRKLDNFFKEFFHPDRTSVEALEFHLVILSPMEPTENLKALLFSPAFDGKISYIIGSALSMEDLVKAGANYAAAMFFLCNTEVGEAMAKLDDAATVLRTLSVHNFNPKLECFVQVLKSEDREILKDSNIDVVLCLDEYKTALQARNAICPGMATFIENLFHTFGGEDDSGDTDGEGAKWLDDYMDGADKEVYYIPMNFEFLDVLTNEWALVVEGLFLEFDVMLIGLANPVEHHIVLNPTRLEMKGYRSSNKFFSNYKIGILLADEQSMAAAVQNGMADPFTVDRIINKILLAEQHFQVRTVKERKNLTTKQADLNKKKKLVKRRSLVLLEKERTQEAQRQKNQQRSDYHRHQIRSLNEIIKATKERGIGIHDKVIESDYEDSKGHEDNEDEAFSGLMVDKEYTRSKKKGMISNLGGMASGVAERGKETFSSFLGALGVPGMNATSSSANLPLRENSDSNLNVLEEDENSDYDDDDNFSTYSGSGSPLLPAVMAATTPGGYSGGGSTPGAATSSPILTPSAIVGMNSGGKSGSGRKGPRPSVVSRKMLFKQNSAHRAGLSVPKKGGRKQSIMEDDFASKLATLLQQGQSGQGLGHTSMELENCDSLKDHIIVFGSVVSLHIFISELRRPLIVGPAYHPVVVVNDTEPPNWSVITEEYSDIYFLKGKMTNSYDFNRTNVKAAFAVVVLASRDSVTKVEEENLDADTLFSFLKLEKYIPRRVFFTVELTCASNMSVLNSTTVRRAQAFMEAELAAKAEQASADNLVNNMAESWKGVRSVRNERTHLMMPSTDNNSTIKRKVMQDKQERGTFTTQRKSSAIVEKLASKDLIKVPLKSKDDKDRDEDKKEEDLQETEHKNREDAFWTVAETHHTLPVFASGRAFVPSTFDSLLCQSFFANYTPILCEKLVCGQKYQTMYQIPCPKGFVGRFFADLFRAFNSKHIFVMAIYRAPHLDDKSVIPFIITCPKPDIVLRESDNLYVFCNPLELNEALATSLNLDLIHVVDDVYSLDERISEKTKEILKEAERKKQEGFSLGSKPKVAPPLVKSLLQKKVNSIKLVNMLSKPSLASLVGAKKVVPIDNSNAVVEVNTTSTAATNTNTNNPNPDLSAQGLSDQDQPPAATVKKVGGWGGLTKKLANPTLNPNAAPAAVGSDNANTVSSTDSNYKSGHKKEGMEGK